MGTLLPLVVEEKTSNPEWKLRYIDSYEKRPTRPVWELKLWGGFLKIEVFLENGKWRTWIDGEQTITCPDRFVRVDAAKRYALRVAKGTLVAIITEMEGVE
jgi:hypothetical protein